MDYHGLAEKIVNNINRVLVGKEKVVETYPP